MNTTGAALQFQLKMGLTHENGLICQCAHCRRVKDFREEERWDWVPDWVTKCPDNTSHTFCPTCFGFYYPSSTHE